MSTLKRYLLPRLGALGLSLASLSVIAPQALAYDVPLAGKITEAKDIIGNNFGDDYFLANYTQLSACLKQWEKESPRVHIVSIGTTEEGRPQYMAIITSPENHQEAGALQGDLRTNWPTPKASPTSRPTPWRAKAKPSSGSTAACTPPKRSIRSSSWSQVYQMVEPQRPRDHALPQRRHRCSASSANPDGQELVANWYMREKDPTEAHASATLPRLYNKYIGHDNNRDFYHVQHAGNHQHEPSVVSSSGIPQIMYNHHQTGPAGAVIFMPPFRDPFNYNFDPLIPLGIEVVGTAMHQRLVAEGKGGSAMRTGANYSTWWNGGLRTVTYFHNMIGILTEIIGDPTPTTVPLCPTSSCPPATFPCRSAPRSGITVARSIT